MALHAMPMPELERPPEDAELRPRPRVVRAAGPTGINARPASDPAGVRPELGPHLGFGPGAHACVGRQIARMRLTTALGAPARRLATPRQAAPFAGTNSAVRGPVDPPVMWP